MRMTPGDLAQSARPHIVDEDVTATEVRLRLASGPDAVSAARRGLDPLGPELGEQRLNDMRLLVSADKRARRSNRRTVIVQGPAAVRRVFEITRLDERLDIVDSPDEIEED